MENPLLVFVSSLIGELFEERKAVKEALKAIPLTRAWVFEYTPASADLLETSYLDKVRECDLFILLLGKGISEPVRKEWETAIEHNKPRLVFLKKVERDPETQSFIERIDVKWAEFANLEELQRKVQEAVIDELIKSYRRYHLRPEEEGKLRELQERLQSGDYIQATISGQVSGQVAIGKGITQVSHETHISGPVYGPVHTGSGDIRIGHLEREEEW
ncbi:MAG: hypothetical protein DRI61_02775 [Chloroflexi bacterium]|nr:MAG: hypothetical protein DRI61_02775 [Chloroflexota bacterium]